MNTAQQQGIWEHMETIIKKSCNCRQNMIVYKSLCEEHNDFSCRGTILQKQTSVRNLPDEKQN